MNGFPLPSDLGLTPQGSLTEKCKAWSPEARAASAEARRGKPKPARMATEKEWIGSFSDDERQSFEDYSLPDFREINVTMRDVASGKISQDQLKESKILQQYYAAGLSMEKALARAPLSDAPILYRGMVFYENNPHLKAVYNKYAAMVPGQEIKARNFISTSRSKDTAIGFMSSMSSSVLLEIRSPKTAVNVDLISSRPLEREALFVRGTTFVVDSIKVNPAVPDAGFSATVRLIVHEK